MSEDNITRGEITAEIKRIDDENNRQNKRIERLEGIVVTINALTVNVERLAVSMESMSKELEKQSSQLKELESAPADNWRSLIKTVITVLVTAAVTYFMTRGV